MFRTTRMCTEWCISARYMLLWLSRQLDYHSTAISNVELDYYQGSTCGLHSEVNTLMILHMELFILLSNQESAGIDTSEKHWEILKVVKHSCNEGYPPKYKKYIN
jgi:hypothetical protein